MHNDRLKEIGFWAPPPSWSPDYKKFEEFVNRNTTSDIKKEVDRRFKIALDTVKAILDSGCDLEMSNLIRSYVAEFNYRLMKHGLNLMPASFNFMEAFMRYEPKYAYFNLLPEIDVNFSFEHFLDWLTNPEMNISLENISSYTEQEYIYSFNNVLRPDQITFDLNGHEKFCFVGASIVRSKTELVIVMLIGLPIDESSAKFDFEGVIMTKGKEALRPSEDLERKVVLLDGALEYQRAIAITRLDINSQIKPFRYLALDVGDSYLTHTDDASIFRSNPVDEKDSEELLNLSEKRLNEVQAVFELAKSLLFLPEYKAHNVENTKLKSYDTELKVKSKTIKGKRLYENADSHAKKYMKEVLDIFPTQSQRVSDDGFYIYSPSFQNPIDGYWQTLKPWEIGSDKTGLPERGRTWIRVDVPVNVPVSSKPIRSTKDSGGRNSEFEGFIYVMRNAQHEKNVFKVGLTTKSTDERASQLSSATGVIDHFSVMHEWRVKDCKLAENQIHKKLEGFRLTGRREFFKVDYKVMFAVIHEVVEAINS